MKGRWPISLMCEVLQVSVSGYFRWNACTRSAKHAARRRHTDDALLVRIRAIHEQLRGEYGWPRMHRGLLARGVSVGKERVRRLMQRHGIRAKGKRKFVVTADSAHRLPVAPDLVQRRTPAFRVNLRSANAAQAGLMTSPKRISLAVLAFIGGTSTACWKPILE